MAVVHVWITNESKIGWGRLYHAFFTYARQVRIYIIAGSGTLWIHMEQATHHNVLCISSVTSPAIFAPVNANIMLIACTKVSKNEDF